MIYLYGFGLLVLGACLGVFVVTWFTANDDDVVAYLQQEIDRLEFELQTALEDLEEWKNKPTHT